jgi:hypothetical protein
VTEKITISIEEPMVGEIDRVRGNMTRQEFISLCIKEQLAGEYQETQKKPGAADCVTMDEFVRFKLEMEKMQMEFMSFFIKYGRQLLGEGHAKAQPEQFSNEDEETSTGIGCYICFPPKWHRSGTIQAPDKHSIGHHWNRKKDFSRVTWF